MTSAIKKAVSVTVSLFVYGMIYLLASTDGTTCTFIYSIIYPTIASDYLNMVVIVSTTYIITYAILYLVYRDKKRRGL